MPSKSIVLLAAALALPATAEAMPRGGTGGAQAGAPNQAPAPSSGKAGTVVAAAESAVGAPYASGGTTLDGFDCSGLTTWAFKKAGVKLPRTSFEQFEIGREVDPTAIRPGDLVFWSTDGAGASHVGIAIASNRAISATTSGGVMEHGIQGGGYWGQAFLGARRR